MLVNFLESLRLQQILNVNLLLLNQLLVDSSNCKVVMPVHLGEVHLQQLVNQIVHCVLDHFSVVLQVGAALLLVFAVEVVDLVVNLAFEILVLVIRVEIFGEIRVAGV